MIVADPHASPKLVGVREERRPPLFSRWLFLGEKPAGFGTERRRRRARGADDPESRLWTFTNASTLPVGVTTRVCTRGESVFLPLSRPYPAGIPLASCRPRAVPFLDVPSLHPSSFLLLRVVPPFRPLSYRHRLLRLVSTVLWSSLRWGRVWLSIFPLIRWTADALGSHGICQPRKLDLIQIHRSSELLDKIYRGLIENLLSEAELALLKKIFANFRENSDPSKLLVLE